MQYIPYLTQIVEEKKSQLKTQIIGIFPTEKKALDALFDKLVRESHLFTYDDIGDCSNSDYDEDDREIRLELVSKYKAKINTLDDLKKLCRKNHGDSWFNEKWIIGLESIMT